MPLYDPATVRQKENRCSRLFVLNSSNLAPGQGQTNHLEVDCAVRKIQDRICDDVAKNIIRSPPSVPYLQKLDLLSMHILAFTLLGFSVVPAAGKVKNS